MKARCENCGEELLGAVNRCWRCGAGVASAVTVDLPPVRRAPPNLPTPKPATGEDAGAVPTADLPVDEDLTPVAESALTDSPTDGSPGLAARSPSTVFGEPDEVVPLAMLRDSAGSNPAQPEVPASAAERLRTGSMSPARSTHYSSIAGAIASLALGGMSLLLSYFTTLALIPAAMGVAMGIWGLYSTRRAMALAGIVLCSLVLLISGFRGIVDLYEYRYGHSPWDPPEEFEVYDDAYFEERSDL
jgi:hypothetical protein